jgi:hypothetical protein
MTLATCKNPQKLWKSLMHRIMSVGIWLFWMNQLDHWPIMMISDFLALAVSVTAQTWSERKNHWHPLHVTDHGNHIPVFKCHVKKHTSPKKVLLLREHTGKNKHCLWIQMRPRWENWLGIFTNREDLPAACLHGKVKHLASTLGSASQPSYIDGENSTIRDPIDYRTAETILIIGFSSPDVILFGMELTEAVPLLGSHVGGRHCEHVAGCSIMVSFISHLKGNHCG